MVGARESALESADGSPVHTRCQCVRRTGLPLQAGSNIAPMSSTHSVLTTRLCLLLTLTHFCHQNTSGPSGNQAVPVPCFENSLKEHPDPQKEAVNVTFNIYDGLTDSKSNFHWPSSFTFLLLV